MLENKLGLTSSAELAREEERISKKKAAMLFENHILDNLESGKFSTLQTIHKYLFDEIYDFAGKLRTVNIAKGNFRFAPLEVSGGRLVLTKNSGNGVSAAAEFAPEVAKQTAVDFSFEYQCEKADKMGLQFRDA